MMTPLRIRARLLRGFVARDPWSPAIDGIVASAVMRDRLGDEYALSAARPSEMCPVEGLPFEVACHGGLWWYCCSALSVIGFRGREGRYRHKRFDDQHERFLDDGVKKVETRAGEYKNWRDRDIRTICDGLEWHVIGDAPAIEPLLRRTRQIGARRGVGYGEVVEWLIDERGDADRARRHRPLPVAYAETIGVAGMTMPWGIAPPARITVTDCVMPEAAHA